MSHKGGVLKRMLRHYSPQIRSRGNLIKHFAKKVGLVYFGSVDQHDDNHALIRGLTVSTTHQDTHYAVGSFNGYDISLVDRFDVISDASHKPSEHSWLILQVSLTSASLPHIFLKPKGHSPESYNKFFTAFHSVSVVNDLLDSSHTREFHGRYEVYSLASRAAEFETLFSPAITSTIAARFWPHAIEIFEGNLYLYITEHRLQETMLGATLEAATWLASVLDTRED